MGILKDGVVFFNNFIKLGNLTKQGEDISLWAVGHDRGVVVMTEFEKNAKHPTTKDIPDRNYLLLTAHDFVKWTGDFNDLWAYADKESYLKALALAKSMVTAPAPLKNKIKGVLLGQAVGDALGFGTEWISKSRAAEIYPEGLSSYEQITRYKNLEHWCPGDWTDDTEQMLCILDSILDKGMVDVKDIASRIHHWAITDGESMGRTVYTAVHTPGFLADPLGTSEKIWEDSGRKWAANGGVMRTSVLAAWNYTGGRKNILDAERVCRITHADPRCTGSCVLVCMAIQRLILGRVSRSGNIVDEIFEAAIEKGDFFHPEIKDYLNKASISLEALDLDEGLNPNEIDRVGYTLKALGAAFWALRYAESFEDGILKIIHEAGDADTNAAVAGAVLGAKFGYEAIPKAWVEGLVYGDMLEEKAEKLAELTYKRRCW